jgi:hypothetical protein
VGALGAPEKHEAEGDFIVAGGECGYLQSKEIGWNFHGMGGITLLIFSFPRRVY